MSVRFKKVTDIPLAPEIIKSGETTLATIEETDEPLMRPKKHMLQKAQEKRVRASYAFVDQQMAFHDPAINQIVSEAQNKMKETLGFKDSNDFSAKKKTRVKSRYMDRKVKASIEIVPTRSNFLKKGDGVYTGWDRSKSPKNARNNARAGGILVN